MFPVKIFSPPITQGISTTSVSTLRSSSSTWLDTCGSVKSVNGSFSGKDDWYLTPIMASLEGKVLFVCFCKEFYTMHFSIKSINISVNVAIITHHYLTILSRHHSHCITFHSHWQLYKQEQFIILAITQIFQTIVCQT